MLTSNEVLFPLTYSYPKLDLMTLNISSDLAKKSVQKAKPKALKAQSSKNNAIVRAFKPKLPPVVNKRPVSGASTRSNTINNQRHIAQKAVAQKAVIVKRQPVGNANGKPKAKPAASAAGSAAKGIKSKLETALQTASAVMRNKNHKNHAEIKQLLDSYKKQWVTEKRFLELLPKLVFE